MSKGIWGVIKLVNPQLEDGFTRLANEIMDVISRCKFNGTEFRIIMVIWRYTYGFNRKEHKMSANFIANAIGIDSSRVRKVLKNLIDSKVILVKKEATFNQPRVLSFNKKYDDWGVEMAGTGEGEPHSPKTTQPQGSKKPQPQGSKTTPKKDSIKDNNKDSTAERTRACEGSSETGVENMKDKNTILNRYLELRGSLHYSPKDVMAAEEIAQEDIPIDDVLKYLEDCFADYEKRKRHNRDRINSLQYCVGYIFDRHYKTSGSPKVDRSESQYDDYDYGF